MGDLIDEKFFFKGLDLNRKVPGLLGAENSSKEFSIFGGPLTNTRGACCLWEVCGKEDLSPHVMVVVPLFPDLQQLPNVTKHIELRS